MNNITQTILISSGAWRPFPVHIFTFAGIQFINTWTVHLGTGDAANGIPPKHTPLFYATPQKFEVTK